jgi:hypothetical protein
LVAGEGEYETKHHFPLAGGMASLFAAFCSTHGVARLGLGCVVQQRLGMRPGEMLTIESDHVLVPTCHDISQRHLVINLGVKQGTKLKRPQSVVLREKDHPDLFRLILLLKLLTPGNVRLFPFTLEKYRFWLKEFSRAYNLPFHWTPHSARAGYASEARAAGRNFTEIQEEGRWISPSSLRVYIDCVAAADLSVFLHSAGLSEAQAYCIAHLESYFPVSILVLR